MAKVNLVQRYTSQLYRNAQVNQEMKLLFVWSTKVVTPKNWITKFELKFPEREKNMNSLENKLK